MNNVKWLTDYDISLSPTKEDMRSCLLLAIVSLFGFIQQFHYSLFFNA